MKAVQGQCRHVGKDFIGDTNIYPPRVAGDLVNAHQTQGKNLPELVEKLQLVQLGLVLLEVTPGHLHVLSHVSALEAQEPSQLVGDEAAGTAIVKEQHGADVVGEGEVDDGSNSLF